MGIEIQNGCFLKCSRCLKTSRILLCWHIALCHLSLMDHSSCDTQKMELFPSSGERFRRVHVYICLCCGAAHTASPGRDCQVTSEKKKKKGKWPKRPAPVRTYDPVWVPKISTGQKPCLRRLLLEHNGRTLREEHLSLGNYPPCTMSKMRDSP